MKTNATHNASKPVVAMYFTYGDRIGGPLTYINTIMASPLKEKYHFMTCFQNQAPGGINLKLLWKMVKELKAIKPDVVHVHGAQSEGLYGIVAAKLAGCGRVVLTIHGFACDSSGCKGIKKYLYKNIVEPFEIRHADCVYCVCKSATKRQIVSKNIRNNSAGYIHNCISKMEVTQNREELRKKLGVAENDVLFAISARVTRDKGFDFLIQLVDRINEEKIESFKLLVIGDGEYAPTFQNAMRTEIENGQVIMVGQTNDVGTYLNASDAFLFPSYHENLSIALIEAGSFGLPCIVSNVGGNAEIVTDQVSGFVMNEHNVDQYVSKIKVLLGDKETFEKMKQNMKEDIYNRFSLETMCKKIDAVYQGDL